MYIHSISPSIEGISRDEDAAGWPDGRVEDAEIGKTVRRLRTVLRPVEPSPIFRQELRLRLALAGRRDRPPVQVASSGELPREVLVGAALLSVAGALVYLWRTRVSHAGAGGSVLAKSSNLPVTAA
ncbi:MAG: hypothetical protein HYX94_08740 [Chloroflexi bacterium]|nr:hypothetical protein [Chloroflexota bacterium]